MYPVDRDRVEEIEGAPPPDVGAPYPVVMDVHGGVTLAYIVHDPDPEWDGSWPRGISPETPTMPIAVATFDRPRAHLNGPPNDEALTGHPLAARGLRPYSVNEVFDSSWIRSLERINAVHPHHRPERYADLRHFVFAFKESVFECVARGVEFIVQRGSIRQVMRQMARDFDGGTRQSDFRNTTPMLKTSDIESTVDFYTRVLGFAVNVLWPEDQPNLCVLDRDDVHLMFSTEADWDAPGSPPALTGQLVFDVADVAGLHRSLEGKVNVLWGPEVYPYGRREFSIKDPNGYRLVFSEPTGDPPTCPA